jgi:hypothetical protein
MPRRPATLTSPAPCGAFLFPSSQPCNRAAQALPCPAAAGLPSALPLSPFRPVRPCLVKAGAACRPCRPSAALAAACDPCAAGFSAAPPPVAGAVRRLPLPRAALCRRLRGFPFPCPVRRPAAGLVKPLCRQPRRPRAAPEGRQPLPLPVITVRRCRPRPAAAGFREGGSET